jgi:small Trp-rich protein
MVAVIVGVLLLVAKLAGFGPVADWSWWIVLAPFGVALAWWQFADSSGLTKRREIEKIEQRKQERREKAIAALGMDARRDRHARQARETAQHRNEMTARREDAKGDGRREPRP